MLLHHDDLPVELMLLHSSLQIVMDCLGDREGHADN